MFDIGFWELALIMVVALLVLGPERLPKVARTAGLWFGRARRMVANVKADIDRELKAEELKRIMAEQANSAGLHEMVDETQAVVDKLHTGIADANLSVDEQAKAKVEPPADNNTAK